MKIIGFLGSKGGVGKTTICVNVAQYLKRQGCGVLIVDADPQGSIRDWQEAAGNDCKFNIIAADRKQTLSQLPSHLSNLNNTVDFVLIDTPGKVSEIMSCAISLSDLCILPVQPSPWDVWATKDILELISIRQDLNPNLKACMLVNRAIPGTNICNDVIAELKKCNVPSFNTCIYQRVVYAVSAKCGQTIFDFKNQEAIKEVNQLGYEVVNVLQ